MTRRLKQDAVIFLLIAIVAIALRVYAIDRLPPGLFGDEAVEGLDALDVLAGNFQIWFHAHLGREPIYVYLVALSYALFGVSPLATRLPALLAGILTVPATYFLVREWASGLLDRPRAHRLALLTTTLIAISFWHIQMTRNAHRDTLLPLVEAMGYLLLWRAFHTHDWKMYAGAGAVLGLAIYTYSPGRFVGVLVALFVIIEFLVWWFVDRRRRTEDEKNTVVGHRSSVIGLAVAAIVALIVMLPLGIYFTQNPAQFSRRFDSTSIFDQSDPALALASSVAGNLAQFVVPGAGYQSKHYNLPGKPIFDLLLAPWFIAGVVIALRRLKQTQYRFLLLWFAVMCVPAFLTADMIPKGVRVLGVVPGIFIFPALAMDGLLERAFNASLHEAIGTTDRARLNRMEVAPPQPFAIVAATGLIVFSLMSSALWTTYDYFVAWATHPDLSLAFDADQTQIADFVQHQPPTQPIYISYPVYRAPTLMLLGERVPTSRYVDRATRFKESDARTTLVANADALYIFAPDRIPPLEWLTRLAPLATPVAGDKYFVAYRLGTFAPPQRFLHNVSFNPFLNLVGISSFGDPPQGIVLYWQVVQLPADRVDSDVTLYFADTYGAVVGQRKQPFGVLPLEWSIGDTIVEWYTFDLPASATQFLIEYTRGGMLWRSPLLKFK